MAHFDIIETSGKAYITAWKERKYLLTLAIVPFIVKAIFFGVVILLGYQDNPFRQTLVMLPAYFMEGWMIAHIVRFVFFGERWPIKLSGNAEEDIVYVQSRGRAIFASIILFTLIQMTWVIFDYFVQYNHKYLAEATENNDPDIFMLLLSTALGIVIIWGFKFLYIYIPLAVDIPIKSFLFRLKGITSSLYMIGAWLICYIPFLLLGGLVLSLLGPAMMENAVAVVLIKLILHTLATVLVSLCFALAFKKMFYDKKEGAQG